MCGQALSSSHKSNNLTNTLPYLGFNVQDLNQVPLFRITSAWFPRQCFGEADFWEKSLLFCVSLFGFNSFIGGPVSAPVFELGHEASERAAVRAT